MAKMRPYLPPTLEELETAVKVIPRESSTGPDGFGSRFFLACWDFIKQDLLEAAKEFFIGACLPRFFTSSYIVLILKVQDPNSFEKFKLISLCSIAYKIFSKIIVGQL